MFDDANKCVDTHVFLNIIEHSIQRFVVFVTQCIYLNVLLLLIHLVKEPARCYTTVSVLRTLIGCLLVCWLLELLVYAHYVCADRPNGKPRVIIIFFYNLGAARRLRMMWVSINF